MVAENKLILEKLGKIEAKLDNIQERLVDIELITEDDLVSLKEAEKDLAKKRTKRL